MTVYPYILSGGSGTRLWPLSRRDYPKQLQTLLGENTLLQQALSLGQDATGSAPSVLANEEHRFSVAEQARSLGIQTAAILLEPFGRNTAPAAIMAALHALTQDGTDPPLVLLMPSDHRIPDGLAFTAAVSKAVSAAEAGHIVTFGIRPTAPETAYGYIRAAAEEVTDGVRQVERFVEKPDRDTAQQFLDAGDYLWNAGIFVFAAEALLAEAERFLPDTLAACFAAFEGAVDDLDFKRLDAAAFAEAENVSLDYGIMERTERAAVLPADFAWSDLGSWDSVWSELGQDTAGNAAVGDALALDCNGCLFHSSGRLIAGLGLQDLAIVDTPDALLVLDRNRAQDVKALVDRLNAEGRSETNNHRRVYRPWGWYDSIDSGTRHQVKILMISPGATLSLQSHNHRSEHWVVVRGTANVTLGTETRLVTENQSVYIPLGTTHRLENPGKIPTQIIEVQTGSYLGEDDIVRYEDVYGRVPDGDDQPS